MSISAPTESSLQQFLRFELPGCVQAMVATQQLTEILSLNLSQIIPISDTHPAMMGVCNWRGEVLWLIDLGCWLGLEPLYQQSLHQGKLNVIIIHHRGRTLGLGVSQVEQMMWCESSQIRPSSVAPVTPELTECLQGYWSAPNGDLWMVLDGEAVFDSIA